MIPSAALLPASLLALASGPLVASVARKTPALLGVLDGFVLVTIGGLVLLEVLPGVLEYRDVAAALIMVVGFVLPTVIERFFRFGMRRTHLAVLALALIGIGIHSALDGSALSQASSDPGSLVGIGILLHQLPVSLLVWLVLSDRHRAWTWVVLVFMASATSFGYVAEPTMLALLPANAALWFEAFVGGSLLHVIAHPVSDHHHGAPVGGPRSHDHDHVHAHDHAQAHDHAHHHEHSHDHAPHQPTHGYHSWPSGVGALTGIVLLVFLHTTQVNASGVDTLRSAWHSFRGLAFESSPAMLLAFLGAGLVTAFLSPGSVTWMNRGSSMRQACSGIVLGLPLPICSCGVVPLYQGLIRQGASTTASIAFLVATPELGLDALLLSVPLLGAKFAAFRLVAVSIAALTVALVAGRWVAGAPRPKLVARADTLPAESVVDRLRMGMRTSLGEMVDHAAPWILLGLLVAALAAPALQNSWLTTLPAGADVVVFALLGLPLYVCASASTPLVAVLVAAGVSPGAGLALLLTGPATNVATLGILTRMHGRSFAVGFAVTMTVVAVVLGLLANVILHNAATISSSALTFESASFVQELSLIALALLFGASILRRGARGFLGELRFAGVA